MERSSKLVRSVGSAFLMAAILALVVVLLAVAALAQNRGGPTSNVRNNAFRSVAVTPSDTVAIQPTSALFVGSTAACNIAMRLNGDTATLTWTNVQIGQLLPVQARLILSTGTTCTGILALYDS